MTGIWLFIISFLTVYIEIICGNIGFFFPGSLFLCYYLTVSYNTAIGFFIGALTSIICEVTLGRGSSCLPMLIPLVIYAEFWRHVGDRQFLFPQSVSGAMIGFFSYLFYVVSDNIQSGIALMPLNLSAVTSFSITIMISAVGLPVYLFFLDSAAGLIDMNIFRTRKHAGHYL